MGPEPLEWLHVPLDNIATALYTVPLINIHDRTDRRGKWRESAKKKNVKMQRDMGEVPVKQNWQERVAEEQLERDRKTNRKRDLQGDRVQQREKE